MIFASLPGGKVNPCAYTALATIHQVYCLLCLFMLTGRNGRFSCMIVRCLSSVSVRYLYVFRSGNEEKMPYDPAISTSFYCRKTTHVNAFTTLANNQLCLFPGKPVHIYWVHQVICLCDCELLIIIEMACPFHLEK